MEINVTRGVSIGLSLTQEKTISKEDILFLQKYCVETPSVMSDASIKALITWKLRNGRLYKDLKKEDKDFIGKKPTYRKGLLVEFGNDFMA